MKSKEIQVTKEVPHVYAAISGVMAKLATSGIGKDRRNEQQNYAFRGIDDVYNALAPLLSAEGLVILPRCISREVTERVNRNGTPLFYVVVDVEFHFTSTKDGSAHIVRMPGEAMDSGDKATNKAMSAAFKYACLQAFCIPTEGDNDADATTHEVAPRIKPIAKQLPAKMGVAEVKAIIDLAATVGVDTDRICAAYGVNSLSDIDLSHLASIIDKLQQKAKAQ